ncbi:MAG: hypothetical protein ACFB4I_03915 [Cyanophyceae cyanobacterium]
MMIAQLFKLKLSKLTLLLLGVLALGALAVVVVKRSTTPENTFYGIRFPAGKVSFADQVVSYNPVIYLDEDLPNVSAPFDNPSTALGGPNSSTLEKPLSSPDRHDVALGIGGSITLKFTDNLLTGSGDDAPDLWIFEAGGVTESVLVEISKDGETWHSVGQTTRQRSGIDIDAFGWGPQEFFSYVRLTDDPHEGDHNGIWKDGEWLGWGGANIDAVGTISSASLEKSAPDVLTSSLPLSRFVISALITFTAGFVAGFLFRRQKK